MGRLEGHPEALRGCTINELRALVGDIELGRSRAREALTHAVSLATAAAETFTNFCGLCCVCLERRKDTALGCGHVLCESCAARVQQCPTCRRPVTSRSRVYL